jgi:hypothetical protein
MLILVMTIKREIIQLKMGKGPENLSPKMISKWSISTRKDTQGREPLKKCKSKPQ